MLRIRQLLPVGGRRSLSYREVVKVRRANRMRRGRLKRSFVRSMLWVPGIFVAALGIVAIALPVGDRRVFTHVELATAGSRYDLTSFELQNLPDKWLHKIITSLPWNAIDEKEHRQLLDRYLALAPELRVARSELENALAVRDPILIAKAQLRLDSLIAERNEFRDPVEEFLESAISAQIVELNLHKFGDFIWPPVDFRIDDAPHLLVTSLRNVIERKNSILLSPVMDEPTKLAIENQIVESADLSAAVFPIGGLASFPNLVTHSYDLTSLLEIAAHEWIHAYLLFQPLGRAYWANGDMTSLNETLATIAGDEIGRMAYNYITGEAIETSVKPRFKDEAEEIEIDPDAFDFNRFMRETRVQTDELLERGEILEAEEYMERRQVELIDHGYNIRKLNQAYFAFYGTYATGPASTSPLARQLWELRVQSDNAGHFIKTLQTISNYDQFLELLEQREID